MIDEIFDRSYQQGRADLNAGLDRAFARIADEVGTTFRAIQAINFAAPWASPGRPSRKGRAGLA